MSSINSRFIAREPGFNQKALRIIAAALVKNSTRRSDSNVVGFLSTLAKRLRAIVYSPGKESIMDLLPSIKISTVFEKYNADVILTHDVDWRACWDCHERIADWEEKAGFKSVFCYLTNGPYKMSAVKLDEMESRGFEIGLHGEWHDIALGCRSKKKIAGFINNSLQSLGRMPVLFRSPALSVSKELFEVLNESGIPRDSSIPVWSQYYPACGYPGPYNYPCTGIIEYPLSIQDDFLFRDLCLSENEALKFTIALLELFRASGGVFVFNTHPGIMIKFDSFYKSFLKYCIENSIRVKTITEISKIKN